MAIKYVPFFPEPIEGQAILDNFKRTLRYKGANDVEGKLRRGMPLYEMEMECYTVSRVDKHPKI